MQLGRLETMDQSRVNHIEKISRIEMLEEKDRIDPDEKYKNLHNNGLAKQTNEVLLDNVKFGYDNDTKEFFIRISKGEQEYQFPTDQILKLKSQLQETLASQIDKN